MQLHVIYEQEKLVQYAINYALFRLLIHFLKYIVSSNKLKEYLIVKKYVCACF